MLEHKVRKDQRSAKKFEKVFKKHRNCIEQATEIFFRHWNWQKGLRKKYIQKEIELKLILWIFSLFRTADCVYNCCAEVLQLHTVASKELEHVFMNIHRAEKELYDQRQLDNANINQMLEFNLNSGIFWECSSTITFVPFWVSEHEITSNVLAASLCSLIIHSFAPNANLLK